MPGVRIVGYMGAQMKDQCDNPDHDWYPYYGVAPHRHNLAATGSFIGSTEVFRRETWPENFVEDLESPGCGVFYCPKCLEGKK